MRTRARHIRQRGFVLVNALVLVAAMAAAAVVLLSRAESGRLRLAAMQEADALDHALDAFEALGRALLDRDLGQGALDTWDEVWTRTTHDVPLALGRVSGRIIDQQGLFNINWLTDPENARAREGLRRLLRQIGVAPQKGDAIAAFVSPQGPGNRAAYRGLEPPVAPLGGSILMLDQLAMLPEVSPDDIELMRPHFTVLPGNSAINVNTAGVALLSALLPEVPAPVLNSVLQRRVQAPFPSVEVFLAEVGLSSDPEDPEAVDPGFFSVGSNWFGAEITAVLEPRSASRRLLYRRESLSDGTQVEWRVSRF